MRTLSYRGLDTGNRVLLEAVLERGRLLDGSNGSSDEQAAHK